MNHKIYVHESGRTTECFNAKDLEHECQMLLSSWPLRRIKENHLPDLHPSLVQVANNNNKFEKIVAKSNRLPSLFVKSLVSIVNHASKVTAPNFL